MESTFGTTIIVARKTFRAHHKDMTNPKNIETAVRIGKMAAEVAATTATAADLMQWGPDADDEAHLAAELGREPTEEEYAAFVDAAEGRAAQLAGEMGQ